MLLAGLRLYPRRRALVAAAAALAAAAAMATGLGARIDQDLRAARDSLRAHPASGQIAIVAIDADSIERIPSWPWSRRLHAEAVDALARAGARTIAFDVDFSSASDPAGDAALAGALKRAGGGVVLPTFRQRGTDGRWKDRLPAPLFRDHALLAAVTVHPDADGAIRTMPYGAETLGIPRPSLAAMVGGADGAAGARFAIDYAIEPASLPMHSFADVIAGRVPAAALRDKHVIIGATAIELGDRYATPRHGVVPGVVIQALAAETLLAGPSPVRVGPAAALLVALLTIAALLAPAPRAARVAAFAAGCLLLLAGPIALEGWWGISLELAPALAALVAAGSAAAALRLAHDVARRVLRNAATALPNLSALELDWTRHPQAGLAVALITNHDALASALGPERAHAAVAKLAERLRLAGGGATLYRTDEATLAWPLGDAGEAAAEALFATAAAMCRVPVEIGGVAVDAVLSFGVAEPRAGGASRLVADAMLAARQAAAAGARWRRFVPEDADQTGWRLSLLGELDRAIVEGHLWLAYQPKLDLRGGVIGGAEALVRWRHPTRGEIMPDAFIPLAEQHGRIAALTEHVLERAIADLATLPSDIQISVNVAANLLADRAIVATIGEALARYGVAPGRLIIEITESAIMSDAGEVSATLDALAALGVKLSIDDYGTGQSTLSYLKRVPAAELKIDQSFVRRVAESRADEILVKSTIEMAHALGLKVVAEGVEDEACLAALTALGCDVAQGWLIGRPAPLDALRTMIGERAAEFRKAA